jgi:branched-chain amino acid transport system substrate-binding protein
VLYQNDSFGKGLTAGFEEGIEGSNIEIVARESYEVTDPSVAPQVSKLAGSGADTFLNVTTPKPGAQAIGAVAKSDWRPLHILNNVSASKTLVIKPVGFEAAQGIVSSTYFKDPEDPQWADDPAMKEYKAQLKKFGPKLNPNEPFNAYGWAAAATMVKALEQAGADLDREKLMEAVRNTPRSACCCRASG